MLLIVFDTVEDSVLSILRVGIPAVADPEPRTVQATGTIFGCRTGHGDIQSVLLQHSPVGHMHRTLHTVCAGLYNKPVRFRGWDPA